MQCRRCSAEIPEESSFCNRCGTTQRDEQPAKASGQAGRDALVTEETLWTGRYLLRAAMHLWVLWGVWVVALIVTYVRFVPERSNTVDVSFLSVALAPGVWMLVKAFARR